MTLLRRVALELLRGASRWTPEASRVWAAAMLQELEWIESDWEALLWALGSTTVIVRLSILDSSARWLEAMSRRYSKGVEERMKDGMGKKAGMAAIGAVAAVVLMLVPFGLMLTIGYFFPGMHIRNAEGIHWLVAIILPGLALLGCVVLLWRTKRPLAIGVLLSVVFMASHLAIHIAHHFHSH